MTDNPIDNIGGTVGRRLTKLVADAMINTRQRMGPHQAGIAQTVLGDFTNHVSDEIRSVMGPLWRAMADHEGTPEEIKPLLHALGNTRGQAWAWIAGTSTSAAMGAGIGDLLTNMLSPFVHSIIAMDPNSVLSATTVAALQVRDLDWDPSESGATWDAYASGINARRLMALRELSQTRPTPADVRELVNRGVMTHESALTELKRLGYESSMAGKLLGLKEYKHSPEILAQMVNRDILSLSDGADLASQDGASVDDFKWLTELGGEPLSPGDLSVAYRRGIIDRARFRKGIVQGPLRKEWFDVLEQLQFERMSTVDAASAVTQGHLTLEQGKRVAHENGLDPDDFATLIEIAGRPPGLDFATEALNRGEISRAQFREMFLESSIKNRYIDLMERMRVRLIPQETARLMYRNGVYPEAKALETLLKHGYSHDDATALLALERARTDDTTKELTRSQIVEMYEERLLSLADATESLISLGYSDDDTQSMIELADLSRLRRFINSAVTRVKSGYVAGRISETETVTTLDALGIPTRQRDDMLALWDIEKTTVSKTLTPAQIRQAARKEFITIDDAMARLAAQGYDSIDANLFLRLTA